VTGVTAGLLGMGRPGLLRGLFGADKFTVNLFCFGTPAVFAPYLGIAPLLWPGAARLGPTLNRCAGCLGSPRAIWLVALGIVFTLLLLLGIKLFLGANI
jgi:hypothetical protein